MGIFELEELKGSLIVSCQARVGWAMHGSKIMAAFATAAQEGGAKAIRANGVDDIKAIKEVVDLPIIGINKIFGDKVYITPTYQSAKEILDLGIEIIALDATKRCRPNDEQLGDIIAKIRTNYPNTLIMGEIDTIEAVEPALAYGIDLISTTLSGYTKYTENNNQVNLELISQIRDISDIPIIAEGMINSPQQAQLALTAGAYAVVVGTSITRPEIITKRYVEALVETEE